MGWVWGHVFKIYRNAPGSLDVMSKKKKKNALEHALKMYGDYANYIQWLLFRKQN